MPSERTTRQVSRQAISANDRQQRYFTLMFGSARFFRKFRLRRINRARHAHSVANVDTGRRSSLRQIPARALGLRHRPTPPPSLPPMPPVKPAPLETTREGIGDRRSGVCWAIPNQEAQSRWLPRPTSAFIIMQNNRRSKLFTCRFRRHAFAGRNFFHCSAASAAWPGCEPIGTG